MNNINTPEADSKIQEATQNNVQEEKTPETKSEQNNVQEATQDLTSVQNNVQEEKTPETKSEQNNVQEATQDPTNEPQENTQKPKKPSVLDWLFNLIDSIQKGTFDPIKWPEIFKFPTPPQAILFEMVELAKKYAEIRVKIKQVEYEQNLNQLNQSKIE